MTKDYPNKMVISLIDQKTIDLLCRAQRLHMDLHGGVAPKPTAIIRDALQKIVLIWEHEANRRQNKNQVTPPAPAAAV